MEKESIDFVQFSEEEIRHAEVCREFSQFLDTQQSVPIGKSRYFQINERYRKEKYGVPSPETLRGFEIVHDRVYPNVARAIRRLNLQGIITRQQLVEADLEKIKLKTGIGQKTYYLSVLLQNICRGDVK